MISDTHPLYNKHQAEWKYYADSVAIPSDLRTFTSALTGKPYVTQFRLEDNKDYQERVEKACPVDICSSGVDLMAGSLSDIQTEIPEEFLQVWEDSDLQDTAMPQLMLEARTKAAIYGHCFLLVDSTRAKSEVVTEADVQAQGIRPFVRILTPLDVTNWRLDEDGNVIEVVYKVTADQQTSILDKATEPRTEYRYWSLNEWRIYRDDVVVESGTNPLGELPLVVLYHKKIQPMLGDSLIRQASRLQQTLTNCLSQIDRTQEMQSFAQACLTSESKPTDVGVGVCSILHLQPETTNSSGEKTGAERFEFVSPDTEPLRLAWETFFKVQQMAYASMSLPGDVLEDKHTSAPESGVAKAYRWKNTDKRLLAMSLNEQEAVREVMKLVGEWMGREFDGSIAYPTSFDLSSLEDSLSNLLALQTVGMPQTALKELKKAAIAKALPRLDADTMDQIDRELQDAMTVADRVTQLTAPMYGG